MSEIVSVHGRRLWDSRGRPAVEAEVTLAGGTRGRAIAPMGASTGRNEAVDLRDGGSAFGGLDVRRAIHNINSEIAAALRGLDAAQQEMIDARLVALDGTPDKSRLGGNALIATSMAVAHAAAAAEHRPLWRHLRGPDAAGEIVLPLPEIQIFGGGAHAMGRVDIQDFMILCPGARSFAEALDWTAEIYHAAGALLGRTSGRQGVADEGGFWPSFPTNEAGLEALVTAIEDAGFRAGGQVAISLDIAASQLYRDGRYHLGLERRSLSSAEFAALVLGWLDRFPIAAVEDPLAEHDTAGLAAFTAAAGERVQVVGDDFLVTSAARVRQAAAAGACNTLLVKPNQIGTLSEAKAAAAAASEAGWGAIISARSGESEDVSLVHLALGWGIRQLKVGSFSRSERMAKWNEMLRIEEALGAKAHFAAGTPLRGRFRTTSPVPA